MTIRNQRRTRAADGLAVPDKINIVGVGVSPTSYEQMTAICGQWVDEHRQLQSKGHSVPSRYVAVTSVHGIVTAARDPEVRSILNGADVATPDGMPVVWALRSFGSRGQQRVYGPTLTLHVCEQAARFGHRIFLYGGRPETLPVLIRNLKERFPGINIVDSYSPPFRPLTPEEDAACVERIEASEADIVLVGISTPKQERWMAEHKARLSGVVMFGVGAAFDFHAGRVKQAPAWMQRNGLEWFFRLTREPGRLWRRYVLETPRFLPLWALQWMGLKKFSMDGSQSGAGS